MTKFLKSTDLTSNTYKDALAIRMDVFVKEQEVPKEMELEYEDECIHIVIYNDDAKAMGTVRLKPLEDLVMKIQRMAVLKEYRGQGVGRQLMLYAEKVARAMGATTLLLGAQVQAIPFYESLGFSICSDMYLDAGIEHKDMDKKLV